VTVLKRHRARLFPKEADSDDGGGNVRPGVCVDTGIALAQVLPSSPPPSPNLAGIAFALVFECRLPAPKPGRKPAARRLQPCLSKSDLGSDL
jgi:hypothetical protein